MPLLTTVAAAPSAPRVRGGGVRARPIVSVLSIFLVALAFAVMPVTSVAARAGAGLQRSTSEATRAASFGEGIRQADEPARAEEHDAEPDAEGADPGDDPAEDEDEQEPGATPEVDGPFDADGTLVKPLHVEGDVPSARDRVVRYEVQPGDSLWSISQAFGISTMTLWWANDRLDEKDYLRVGQVLRIPPGDGILHRVVEGDTLDSLAERYRVEPDVIEAENGIQGGVLVLGQLLYLPGGRGEPYRPRGFDFLPGGANDGSGPIQGAGSALLAWGQQGLQPGAYTAGVPPADVPPTVPAAPGADPVPPGSAIVAPPASVIVAPSGDDGPGTDAPGSSEPPGAAGPSTPTPGGRDNPGTAGGSDGTARAPGVSRGDAPGGWDDDPFGFHAPDDVGWSHHGLSGIDPASLALLPPATDLPVEASLIPPPDGRPVEEGEVVDSNDARLSLSPAAVRRERSFIWPVGGGGGAVSQYYHGDHHGLDVAAPLGTPVVAVAPGRVVYAGWRYNGGGYQVWIKHASGFYTTYNHLDEHLTRAGAWVETGQLIGRVGSTGYSTGPHLHFEVLVGGTPAAYGHREDPLAYVRP